MQFTLCKCHLHYVNVIYVTLYYVNVTSVLSRQFTLCYTNAISIRLIQFVTYGYINTMLI